MNRRRRRKASAGEQAGMHREVKGAAGWGPGDVLGLSAKWAAAGAVTGSSKCSGCGVGRGR